MSGWSISPERQADAIRLSHALAGNRGLRASRERYVEEWRQKSSEEIRVEMERLRRWVEYQGRPRGGDLMDEPWRLAALETALEGRSG